MKYSKQAKLYILFVFSVFSCPHVAVAMEQQHDQLPTLVNKQMQNAQLIETASNIHRFLAWMKRYLAQGANTNATDTEITSALHYAKVYLREEVAKFLPKNGANPNKKDAKGYTSLMRVVQYSKAADRIYAPLYKVDDIHGSDRYGDKARNGIVQDHTQIPGMWVDPFHCVYVIEQLLTHGAHLNAQDNDGKTALMHAGDNLWLAELLLARGADPDVQDNDGFTALMDASKNRNLVILLLKAGASPNLKDEKYGATVLHRAAVDVDINRMQLLTEYGADYHIADKGGRTPFSISEPALWSNLVQTSKEQSIKNEDLLWYILYGGNLEFQDNAYDTYTLLHHVALRNQIKCIQTLLAYGAFAAARGNCEKTPLHLAALSGHKDAIKALLTYPQGSPRYQSKDVASSEQIITFFLCLKRLFDGKGDERLKKIKFPRQIRRHLFLPYLMPKSKLIDKVPLLQLRQYVKFIGKNGKEELANALTERHVNQVANILSSVDKWEMTPLGKAQQGGHHGEEIQDLLRHDRTSLRATFGKQIKDNYLVLLK